ncbi:MAG: hypothetical protein Q8K97_04570 [Pseudohongiella sp.]|nr:hypothetical protein [Pseudohongiella sp.]
MTKQLGSRIRDDINRRTEGYTAKQWVALTFHLILAVDSIIVVAAFLGTFAGAALMGSMFASLGLVPPFIFLQLFGLNATTAGLINLVVTVAVVAYLYGQRKVPEETN